MSLTKLGIGECLAASRGHLLAVPVGCTRLTCTLRWRHCTERRYSVVSMWRHTVRCRYVLAAPLNNVRISCHGHAPCKTVQCPCWSFTAIAVVYVVVIAAIIIFRRLELLQRQLRTHLPLYCVLEVPRMRRGYDVRHCTRQVAVGIASRRVVSADPYQKIQAIDMHEHVRCAGSTSHAFTVGPQTYHMQTYSSRRGSV